MVSVLAAFHGTAELDYAQGLLHIENGHHDRAVHFLRAALSHQDRTYGRNRALYRLTLTHSLIQAGDADEDASHARDCLGHLDEIESGRVMRRLSEVVAHLDRVDAADVLHTRLLDGLDAERVTLTVRPEPEAAAARSAYQAWEYRGIGTSHPWEGAPLYNCMVRELR